MRRLRSSPQEVIKMLESLIWVGRLVTNVAAVLTIMGGAVGGFFYGYGVDAASGRYPSMMGTTTNELIYGAIGLLVSTLIAGSTF